MVRKEDLLIGFTLGLAIGLLIAIGGVGICTHRWNQWCLDQGYASYDAKTGVLVYVEKEE